MQLRFHPLARAEYVDALVYLEQRREGYGERFEAEVRAACERIENFPESGTRVPGYPDGTNVRAFPLRIFKYTLIVSVEQERAIV